MLSEAVSHCLFTEEMTNVDVQEKRIAKKGETFPEKSKASVLRCFYSPIAGNYLNLVVDKLECDELSEWENLVLVFTILLAQKTSLNLRIITRKKLACRRNILALIDTNKIDWVKNIEFEFIPHADREIPINERNIFLTASGISSEGSVDRIDEKAISFFLDRSEIKPGYVNFLKTKEITFIVHDASLYERINSNGFEQVFKTRCYIDLFPEKDLPRYKDELMFEGTHNLFGDIL